MTIVIFWVVVRTTGNNIVAGLMCLIR